MMRIVGELPERRKRTPGRASLDKERIHSVRNVGELSERMKGTPEEASLDDPQRRTIAKKIPAWRYFIGGGGLFDKKSSQGGVVRIRRL